MNKYRSHGTASLCDVAFKSQTVTSFIITTMDQNVISFIRLKYLWLHFEDSLLCDKCSGDVTMMSPCDSNVAVIWRFRREDFLVRYILLWVTKQHQNIVTWELPGDPWLVYCKVDSIVILYCIDSTVKSPWVLKSQDDNILLSLDGGGGSILKQISWWL